MTENELLVAVTDALDLFRWTWFHDRRTDRAQHMGDAGVPDILAIKGTRLLAWELKSAKGKVTPEQQLWLNAWQDVGADARVVRPADLDDVLEVLRG